MTGAYSMSGGDLRALLMLLRTDTLGRVPRKAGLLLRTMCHMAKHDGPSSFFDFAKPGAGIVRNSTLRRVEKCLPRNTSAARTLKQHPTVQLSMSLCLFSDV